MQNSNVNLNRRGLIRNWWLPLVAIVIVAGAIYYIRAISPQEQQPKNLQTYAVAGGAMILLILWFALFAPLAGRTRTIALLVFFTLCGTAAATLKVEDWDGDLWPTRIVWRWTPKPDETLPPLEIVAANESEARAANGDANANGGGTSNGNDANNDNANANSQNGSSSSPRSNAEASPFALPDESIALPGLADYPQFLGPNRNATLTGPTLSRDWSQPPRELWRRKLGAAWSAFAVAGRRAVTQEQRGPHEMVVCYDVATGRPLWAHRDQTRYETGLGGVGPRATPTIDGDRVFTLGATGILNCLDLRTGRRQWSVNILEDNDAVMPDWGMAGSPLVDGDRVIVPAGNPDGRSLVAYHRETGERLWTAGDGASSYGSPALIDLAGETFIVQLNQTQVAGHDRATGAQRWAHPFPGRNPKAAQPVALPGDRLLVSAGYGVGAALFEVTRTDDDTFDTEQLWKHGRLRAKFTNLAHRDGHIYGLHDGLLICIHADSGRTVWRGEEYGHGQLILVGDLLLITAEDGHVVLVSASPDGFREHTRFRAFEHKMWNSPALAGRYLLVRNDREAACFELPE